ncbi:MULTISPECIES: hypothetical protein [Streptomyces]|nr:hypothetical protein [Streptomyces chartreusis]
MDDLFGQLVEAGVGEVFMEHIDVKRYIRERMDQVSPTRRERLGRST